MAESKHLMSYDYLLRSQAEVAAETDRRMPGLAKLFPPVIDCLLKLPHWAGSDPGEGPDLYRWWAHSAYVAAGHSVAVVHQLLRSGFYLEALVLDRHLSEVLVQLVYLRHHPDKGESHFIPAEFQAGRQLTAAEHSGPMPKRKSIQFKKMFDSIVPGYYERHYRRASEFAHGGVASGMLRNEQPEQRVVLGCKYDATHAEFVTNNAVAMLYGFLRRFPEVFPEWNATDAEPVYGDAIKSLDDFLKAQWAQFPESREWLGAVGKLIAWDTPAELKSKPPTP